MFSRMVGEYGPRKIKKENKKAVQKNHVFMTQEKHDYKPEELNQDGKKKEPYKERRLLKTSQKRRKCW